MLDAESQMRRTDVRRTGVRACLLLFIHSSSVITLMRHYLAAYHPALARRLAVFTRVRRWAGDTAYGSKGEILIAGGC